MLCVTAVSRRAGIGAVALFALLTASPAVADEPNPLTALVDAAAQRLQTANAVAAYKWIEGGNIEDPQREAQVLDAVGATATANGIDPGYVHAAFRDQIDATVGVEYSRFADWKFDPATAPSTAPDLAASRGVIDGLNTTMVAEMARQWNLLHSAACPQALTDATATVAAARGLDEEFQRGLAAAARSYCR